MVKRASDLKTLDIIKLINGEVLKIFKINKGIGTIEYQGKKANCIMLTFESGKWSQVHPDEEFEVI